MPAAPMSQAPSPAAAAGTAFKDKVKFDAAPPPPVLKASSGNDFKEERAPLTTQASSQLRPTGRRSLQVEVPATGEFCHFRKLKDHAVLDLPMKKEWQQGKAGQATAVGFGLGAWG